ncbi:MAG: hypothetical protein ACXVCP_15555 [Bdellovibrio sp.]
MKKVISKLIVFAVCLYSSLTFAGPVNDTNTNLISYGNGNSDDCSVIKPYYGYITYYGSHGGAGKSIVLGLKVTNLSYAKDLWVGIEGQGWQQGDLTGGHGGARPVVNTLGWNSNTTFFEIIDNRIGPDNSVVLHVSVKMNEQIYNCSFIKIGQ